MYEELILLSRIKFVFIINDYESQLFNKLLYEY